MNIPNSITMGRLFLCLLIFVLLAFLPQVPPLPSWQIWTITALFILAAASDFLDGFLARRYGQVTRFGRVADPFVDKILVLGTATFLCARPETGSLLPPWMVVVILGREFLVSGIRSLAESEGIDFSAILSGKWKFTVQALALGFLLGRMAGVSLAETFLTPLLVWAALALTIWSGGVYLVRGRKALRL